MREITPYGMISNAISCSSLRYVPISGDRTKEESENGRYTAGKPTGMVQRPDREHEEGMDYQRGAGSGDRCHVTWHQVAGGATRRFGKRSGEPGRAGAGCPHARGPSRDGGAGRY